MIKARGGNNFVFGLSEKNIEELKKGHPILIEMSKLIGKKELDVHDMRVMIFYGKTEIEMQKELAEFIGPKTKYHSDFDN